MGESPLDGDLLQLLFQLLGGLASLPDSLRFCIASEVRRMLLLNILVQYVLLVKIGQLAGFSFDFSWCWLIHGVDDLLRVTWRDRFSLLNH